MNTIGRVLWSEAFWLPENTTWDDLDVYTKKFRSLTNIWDCLYTAFFLSVLRFSISSFFVHLGLSLGIKKPVYRRVPPIPLLESTFTTTKRPSKRMLHSLSESLNMDEKSVEIWFRNKRNESKFPVVVKFSESGWKLCFYTTMFFYGIYALHDKPYIYDIQQTISGYPAFWMTWEIYWYYMIELGYYVSEMGWIFYGVRRTDFRVLLLHHVATVGLMLFSYVTNHHRIGAIVLVVHDIADCWMESAKMFKYVNKHRIAEILFAIFMVIWVITRLTYFPFWIIYTVLTTGFEVYGWHPMLFIFVGLLSTLQVMHVFWFYLICKIALQVKSDPKKAKDCRSDSESSEECVESNGVSAPNSVDAKRVTANHQLAQKSNGIAPHATDQWIKQRNCTLNSLPTSRNIPDQMNGK